MRLALPKFVRHTRLLFATIVALAIGAGTLFAQFGTFPPSFNGELWGVRHELTLANDGAPSGVVFINGTLFVADGANRTIVAYDSSAQVVAIPNAKWNATQALSPIFGFVPHQLASATVTVNGTDRAAILMSDQASNRVAAFDTAGNHLFTLRLTRPTLLPTLTLGINEIAMAPGAKFTLTTGVTPTLSLTGTFAAAWVEQLLTGTVNSGTLVYRSSPSFVSLLGEFNVSATNVLTGKESDPVAPTPVNMFGVAFDKVGNLYVLDSITERLNVYGPAMNHLFTFGTPVPDLSTAEFHEPYGMDFWPDASGNGGRLFVADTYKSRILVYRPTDGPDTDLVVDSLQLESTITNFPLDLDNLAQFGLAVDASSNRIATSDLAASALILSTFRLTAFNLQVLDASDQVVDSMCTAASYKVRFSLTVPAGFSPVTNVAPSLVVDGSPVGGAVPFASYPSTTLSAGDVVTYTYSVTAPSTAGSDMSLMASATAGNTSDIAGRSQTVPLADCAADTHPSTITATPMRAPQVSGWTPVFAGETFYVDLSAQDGDGIESIAYMLEGAVETGDEPVEIAFTGDPTTATTRVDIPDQGRTTLRYHVRDANGVWSPWRTLDLRPKFVFDRTTNENTSTEFRVGDPEGVGFTYSVNRVPDGVTFSTQTGQFAGIPSFNANQPYSSDPVVASGVYNVVVTEHASSGQTSSVAFTWTINHVNRSPSISTINGFTVNTGTAFSLQVNGFDPDGDPSFWTMNGHGVNNGQDVPAGIVIDPTTGLIHGTFPNGSDTQYILNVGLSECAYVGQSPPCQGLMLNHEHLATLYEISLAVINLNNRADVVNPGPKANNENDSPVLQIVASDPEGDTLEYRISGQPTGLDIDALTGVISGTVGWDASGPTGVKTYPTTVEVFDHVNILPRAVTFNWTITNKNRPPVVQPPNRQNNEGETVTGSLVTFASDPEGSPIQFVSMTGQPTGLTLSSTGVLGGTIGFNSAGTYQVTVVVSDGALPGTGTFTWTILDVNRPPVLIVADQFSVEGATVTLPINGTDPDGSPLSFSMNGLPAGFNINASTGVITGTFAPGSAGVYTVNVGLVDGGAGGVGLLKTFKWTVTKPNQAPVITNPGNRTNYEGENISLQIVATDPDSTTLTFSATGLPPGLSISPSGLITGSLSYTSAGVYPTSTITVSDGTSSRSVTFTWTVIDVNRPPVATNDATTALQGQSVVINVRTNDADPDGSALTVVGVTTPSSGSVVISGSGTTVTYTAAPTFTGIATFNYTVSDGNLTATATVTVTVAAATCTVSGYTTYSQGGWGNGGAPGQLMASKFAQVYPLGYVIIGGSRTLKFTSAAAIDAFLPAGGSPAMLTASAVNPTSSSAGNFAAQTLALRLAVDYSDAGVLKAGLGNLVMVSGPLANQTVNQILATANAVLGGSSSSLPSGMSVSALSSIIESLNLNFHEGTVNNGLLACPTGPCVSGTFTLTGNSATYGTAGNIRSFAASGVNVKVSAFSRLKSGGTWATAYLGAYGPGLGVTDGSEGTGSGDTHMVDNVGDRNNYMLFEFSQPITITKAYLDYVGVDSDVTVWVGTKTDPYNNHLTLSDALLSSLGAPEDGTTTSGDARWAMFNGSQVSGNVLVIAAHATGTDDSFKVAKLAFSSCDSTPMCVAGTMVTNGSSSTYGTAGNIRSFNSGDVAVKASAFARAKSTGAWTASYLGAFAPGLGVTDGSEGSGADDSHKVDNVGDRVNYVLFEFNKNVTVSKAYLEYIGADGDMTVWVGTKNDPYNNHQTLSDAFLSGLGMTESVESESSVTRWMEFNENEISGNVLVIAARPNGTNDAFKIGKLQFEACPQTNHAPTVDAAARSNYKKTAVSVQISGGDADGDVLSYTATGLPAGLSISAAGLITGTPTTTGTYTVTITAKDPSNETGSATFVWTIQNHAPTITMANITTPVGMSGTAQIYGADADNDAMTYSASGLPPGVYLSPSGLFSGALTQAGVYTTTVTVKDVDNAVGSSTFTWTVTQANRAPVAGSDSVSTKKNTSVTINVLANDSDPDGDALTVSVSATCVNGTLSRNSANAITFTPATNYKGTTSFTYTVSDGKGGTATGTVTVKVS